MKHYSYHGFEPTCDFSFSIKHKLKIIKSGGIKRRARLSNTIDPKLDHVCLYRKNENFKYENTPESMLQSAKSGWIDNCMVFIISDTINAKYIPPNTEVEGYGLKTNLVDEWRSREDIPLDKIIGIALPLDSIRNVLNGKDKFYNRPEEIAKLKNDLLKLKKVCDKLGFKTYNSEIPNFTDRIDSQNKDLSFPEEYII